MPWASNACWNAKLSASVIVGRVGFGSSGKDKLGDETGTTAESASLFFCSVIEPGLIVGPFVGVAPGAIGGHEDVHIALELQ
jgi:hypothetical protein